MDTEEITFIDQAITDCIKCVNKVLGVSERTKNISEYYLNNKLQIISKLRTAMHHDRTIVKIINNSVPILCDLALCAYPDFSHFLGSL